MGESNEAAPPTRLEGLEDEIKGIYTELLANAEGDVEAYGRDIARGLIEAVQSGDQARKERLGHQLEGLAEINRIRANKATWRVIEGITDRLFNIAFALIG